MTEHDPDSNIFASPPTQSDISAVERMMSEIPDDVLEAASDAYAEAFHAHQFGLADPDEIIARAILAERERCAKIADDYPYNKPNHAFFENTGIARRIRGEA